MTGAGAPRIDVNCDIGEGYGRWQMPHDAALIRTVTSVSVAAGFHAGDPGTIRATVRDAVENGLDVGVHVALPDMLGFGRREMAVSACEVRDYCTYQIGAVQAFVAACGSRLTHVKPHGALYAMTSRDVHLAGAIATAAADAGVPRLFLLDDRFAGVADEHGVEVVTEGFPELGYADDGTLVLERDKKPWEPAEVGARAVRMVTGQRVRSRSGRELKVSPRTLCVHSDADNADRVARRVLADLRSADVRVCSLSAP
ncbi:5-oxoprolinase subunit PxpA [Amycolatopsis sp. RTGN1]|uniref:5-oxoprolinase subunit PxpA n=1 Tax=Amycolatopsis ponsaeliensis TaxID=2992142 RepID=UPI00254F2EDC|nr:5-oxoprolinase subunit PxpA [Amycolatopsis sp. RTGN1]